MLNGGLEPEGKEPALSLWPPSFEYALFVIGPRDGPLWAAAMAGFRPDSVERAQAVAVVSLIWSREHAERFSFVRFSLKFGCAGVLVYASGPCCAACT